MNEKPRGGCVIRSALLAIWKFIKGNKLSTSLILAAAVGITVAAVSVRQPALTVLPLYISLFVGMLSAGANRYANVIGAANCLLYTVVNFSFGLYAQALSALLLSCPLQIITFIRWNRHAYKNSTKFRALKPWQLLTLIGLSASAYAVIALALNAADSSHPYLDNAMTVLGVVSPMLSLLAFREYAWVQLMVGVVSLVLDSSIMAENPARIAFFIYSIYSMICIIRQFFSVRRLWREQQGKTSENTSDEASEDMSAGDMPSDGEV